MSIVFSFEQSNSLKVVDFHCYQSCSHTTLCRTCFLRRRVMLYPSVLRKLEVEHYKHALRPYS